MDTKVYTTLGIIFVLSLVTFIYATIAEYEDTWEQEDITAYHSMAVESTTNDGYNLVTHIAIKGRISEERKELITRIIKGATADYDPNSGESRARAEVEINTNLEHKLVPVRDISIWEKVIKVTCDKTGCYNEPLKGEGK